MNIAELQAEVAQAIGRNAPEVVSDYHVAQERMLDRARQGHMDFDYTLRVSYIEYFKFLMERDGFKVDASGRSHLDADKVHNLRTVTISWDTSPAE